MSVTNLKAALPPSRYRTGKTAAAACPRPADLVIEIGPGRGALTAKLLERAARVVAIELASGAVPLH